MRNDTIENENEKQRIYQQIINNLKLVFNQSIVILFLGPPACGKGTQANKIKKVVEESIEEDILLVTTGDLCKSFLSASDEISNTARSKLLEIMNQKGGLLPTHVKVFLWTRELFSQKKDLSKCNVIFDGSPRDKSEAVALIEALEFWGRKSIVVKFNIPDNTSGDEQLFHRIKMGSRGREDDKGLVPEKRINEYKSKLPELLSFFNDKKIPVVEIDATLGIDDVFKLISIKLKQAMYKLK